MKHYNDNLKKLLKIHNIDTLIEIINEKINELQTNKNNLYKRNIKYTNQDYILVIIEVLKNHTSWNSYNGLIKGDLRK